MQKPFIVVPVGMVGRMKEICGSSVDVLTSLPFPSMKEGGDEESEEEGSEVVVCAGPPRCNLEGDAAVEAAEAGCVWCLRITIHPDGSETATGPGVA